MNKTALLLGATGLVGSELLQQLLIDDTFSQVLVFTRSALEFSHPKLKNEVIDFNNPDSWIEKVKGDVLFSAFGTTIKKAGTKENQWKIDYTYQYQMAHAACKNGVPAMVLVSSAGASANSKIFYSRMKGELDRDIKALGFERLTILKPSILAGHRNEKRVGESYGLIIGKLLKKIPYLNRYQSIPASTVAKAMIQASKLNQSYAEFQLLEIFNLSKGK
ncbi:MAG: NAD(P)H-binding protein [Salinivirgaceae bacterium]|jgi:uncharacterized protein YbjT (DUF2867 family)